MNSWTWIAPTSHLRVDGLRMLCGAVLLVGDVLTPRDRAARVVDLLHREVGHEAGGRGAVPVVLARLEEHAVTGVDDLDRPSAALAAPDALGDVDGLAEGVGVPSGAGAGREVDAGGRQPRGRRRGRDGVDVDRAGEPVAGPRVRVKGVAGDLHGGPAPGLREIARR